MGVLRKVGLVLHPARDSQQAIRTILDWARGKGVEVLGLKEEVQRIDCEAVAVETAELAAACDLVISLGGDGTMLRAMRMMHGHRGAILPVNLGRLGFLAEVDVPDLAAALGQIDAGEYRVEPRSAVAGSVPAWSAGLTDGGLTESGPTQLLAFNDIALVRTPGHGLASVELSVGGQPFLRYAADAVVVATPTGSTAYSFSAGGPIISPTVRGLVVTPAAPHSAFNRSVVLDCAETLALSVEPGSGALAVEVDGVVAGTAEPGTTLELRTDPDAAQVVRLGEATFYQRVRRKLGLVDGASYR
ncbi:NAD(+)/NADH kinase [Cryptosporangium aurantiacum]|uniref:NAD kinase n=1 Tax=Cryptosporangium aurantiacum TaxID=134849 RepID=A0A1M7RIH1_9ACTN|nr:NAD(+)/NADH kinase [Cryptosporangium aurantiacum]SHN45990.1 NAD+ kinase [Cryptosporangium aurantiacum]